MKRVRLTRFFDKFLRNRGLKKPNGQMLYKYNCGDEEYRRLRDLLTESGDPKQLRTQMDGHGHIRTDNANCEHDDTDEVMTCFVLYASEWYRRWTNVRRRTWRILFNSIDWPHENYPELYQAIANGLKRWKRPVIKMPGSTRYFDTIGREAGIPIRGFEVVEYQLLYEDEDQVLHYEPGPQSEGIESGRIQIRKNRFEDIASKRIIGLFDTGTRR